MPQQFQQAAGLSLSVIAWRLNGRRVLNDTIAGLDRHLADSPYVTGSGFTVFDIPAGVYAYRFFKLDIARRPMPALEAWYRRLYERPPDRQHVMIGLG